MALYNPGGDGKPIAKYDAKEGIFKIDNDPVPVKNFKAIFDMDTLELGYCRFSEGAAPDGTWRQHPTPRQSRH